MTAEGSVDITSMQRLISWTGMRMDAVNKAGSCNLVQHNDISISTPRRPTQGKVDLSRPPSRGHRVLFRYEEVLVLVQMGEHELEYLKAKR